MNDSTSCDIAIIGGGHNGLVCAAYLARAGRRVTVLEAADRVGGACATVDIGEGYRASPVAQLLYGLDAGIVRDLKLRGHGLRFTALPMPTVSLGGDGRHLVIDGRGGISVGNVGDFPQADFAALRAFDRRMRRFAGILAGLNRHTPPRLSMEDWESRREALRMAWSVRRLGRREMREFLRVVGMNMADLLEESFESQLLRGTLAFDAVLGTRLGPRSPGSVFTYLHRLSLQAASYTGRRREVLTVPHHGMGALADALAAAARAAGAIIRTAARVESVRIEQGRACGVVLDGGEEIAAKTVVSSADPRQTFLDLVGPRELDAGFVRRIHNLRSRGAVARLDLALDGAPEPGGVDASRLGSRFVISPGVEYAEQAFNPSKYGEWSEQPVFELIVPSAHDSSLAPAGRHVLSVLAQYAPHELRGGWSGRREAYADHLLAQLEPYLPGLGRRVVHRRLLTPEDIEREYRISGGHWHHAELAFDQALMLRPVPGAGRYATPVPGLYLCGAGSHPGGGVSGLPGRNAARRILAESA